MAGATNGKGSDDDFAAGETMPSRRRDESVESGKGESDPDLLARGSTLGRYLVLEHLGAGAMGVVYAAYDPELDRKVAIKLLRPTAKGAGDAAYRQARLVREAKAIAKLSHPNVVGIFDVGVHEGQVFLAMEHLGGGTLRDWLAAAKRPWREVVKLFIEVGNGLAAAHAEGLIHRDFKPDNILLDRTGKPKVVDFGLVRSSSTTESSSGEHDTTVTADLGPGSTSREASPLRLHLTRTGALTGTPAYMAPEQFMGHSIDARSDQFAFWVSLYEALFGQRPFSGETLIALADNVTSGTLREPPVRHEVPRWLARLLNRGLSRSPDERFASMTDVVAALSKDPVQRRNRVLLTTGALLAVFATLGIAMKQATSRRRELMESANKHLAQARAGLETGRRLDAVAVTLRSKALEAFDSSRPADGEKLWTEAQEAERDQDEALRKGYADFESARVLYPALPADNLPESLATTLVGLLERRGQDDQIASFLATVSDESLAKTIRGRLAEPSHVSIATTPAGATLTIQRYAKERNGQRALKPVPESSRMFAAPAKLDLAPGSYLLTARAPGHADLSWPFIVRAGEKRSFELPLMPAARVPQGYVFVPAGEFLFGSADESLRRSFLDAVPIHTLRTEAFFIAQHETTIGEWLKFVGSLPARDRQRYLPGANEPTAGKIALHEVSDGWELIFQPWSTQFRVRSGQALIYPGRTTFASHDWSRLPVTGIGIQEVLEYLRWLGTSGGVPGARLCDEREWERAARGADDRSYPHGDRLAAQDANFDEAFGKDARLFGLEEVGLRKASTSPFGVADMAGNAFEFTRSFISPGEFVVRGGSYFQNANTTRSDNRALIDVTTKGQSIGLRVCANAN